MSKDREEFIAQMVHQFPGKTPSEVLDLSRLLMRHAKTYRRLQEIDCNQGLSLKELKKEANTVNCIRKLAEELGTTGVVFQGDPRGATVKLQVPSGYTNDWGQEGICVPGS